MQNAAANVGVDVGKAGMALLKRRHYCRKRVKLEHAKWRNDAAILVLVSAKPG